jgi:hypothetical protein
MDRRLKRIERWLKRCVAACKCGSWGDALIEIECLEAEAREARGELWLAAEEEAGEASRRRFGPFFAKGLKVASLAMAMVLAAVIPLSTEFDAQMPGFPEPMESFAILSGPESDIINALRESLSSGNSGRVTITVELPAKSPEPAPKRGAALAAESVLAAAKPQSDPTAVEPREEPASPPVPEERRPSVEEVVSLIQVGQRALRVPEPAVRVMP